MYMAGADLEEDKRKNKKFSPEAEACSKQGVEVEEDGGGDQDRELVKFIALGSDTGIVKRLRTVFRDKIASELS